MATTFGTAKAALDEIAERLRTNNAAAAAANPNNPALTTMKAEADLLVAEFQAAKTRATTMDNAIKDL